MKLRPFARMYSDGRTSFPRYCFSLGNRPTGRSSFHALPRIRAFVDYALFCWDFSGITFCITRRWTSSDSIGV